MRHYIIIALHHVQGVAAQVLPKEWTTLLYIIVGGFLLLNIIISCNN